MTEPLPDVRACLTADEVSALSVHGKIDDDLVVEHVARCGNCREWLLAALPTDGADDRQRDSTLVEGESVGRYQIIRSVGRGAFGEVYLARDPDLKRDVAIKFLSHDRSWPADTAATFAREAQALATVHHPFVVGVYDVGSHEIEGVASPYFVMEFVAGGTMAQRAASATRQQKMRWLWQLSSALRAVHQASVVHRDVKPANVLIAESGDIKLTDFGLSQYRHAAGTGQVGTPAYMAPEVARGEPATTLSDQYSFAIVAAELLDGCRPATVHAATLQHVTAVVADALRKAGAVDVAARWQSMAAIERVLHPIDRSRSYRTMALAAATLATAAVATGLWFGLQKSTRATFCEASAATMKRVSFDCEHTSQDAKHNCTATENQLNEFVDKWNRASAESCNATPDANTREAVEFCFQRQAAAFEGIVELTGKPTYPWAQVDLSDTPLPSPLQCSRAPLAQPAPPPNQILTEVLRLNTELINSNPVLTGSVDKSLELYKKFSERAHALGYAPLEARVNDLIALTFSQTSSAASSELAWQYFQKAWQLADEGQDLDAKVDIAAHIAMFESGRGHNESALSYVAQAVAIEKRTGGSNINLLMARVNFEPLQFTTADLDAALVGKNVLTDIMIRAAHINGLTQTDAMLTIVPDATSLAKRCATVKDQRAVACESILANAFARIGFARQAGEHAQRALQIFSELHWPAQPLLLRAALFAAVHMKDAKAEAGVIEQTCAQLPDRCDAVKRQAAMFRGDYRDDLQTWRNSKEGIINVAGLREAAIATKDWKLLGEVLDVGDRAKSPSATDVYLQKYARALYLRARAASPQARVAIAEAIAWREKYLPQSPGVEDRFLDVVLAAELAAEAGAIDEARDWLRKGEARFATYPALQAQLLIAMYKLDATPELAADIETTLTALAIDDVLTADQLRLRWQP
jgi:serine/threonine protein kinase